MKHDVSCMLW